MSSNLRNPEVGMLATVRKRRGIVSEVREFFTPQGMQHVVRVDYRDDAQPLQESLLWELEPHANILEPNALPEFVAAPMESQDLDALIRAARWNALNSYVDPDDEGELERLPVSAPLHGAVQVEDYQMVPLLKALRMPRVNLLLADDVGLGKTIEAGLILSELLLRRRVNRVLILTPASLRIQWQEELWSKFSLPFDVLDRNFTLHTKRTLGIDANPWRSSSRIVASYHYLKQPDVLEQFMSASRSTEGSAHLPWDLLIVDETHNLMPASFGEDSQLCTMLRKIAPLFEHRLFLTATPHNGHTRSFTGLLELLDPVRFSMTDDLKPAEKERIRQVVIRRLKREINSRSEVPRFCTRMPPEALLLDPYLHPGERSLADAFEAFRHRIRLLISGAAKQRKLAGSFAIEILGKRMLSGPMTFLESWQRCKQGLKEENIASEREVVALAKSAQEEIADDQETQQRENSTATVIGAWMRGFAKEAESEIKALDLAASELNIDLDQEILRQNPAGDGRFERLFRLIESQLKTGSQWSSDERLVVFTEYKTTLDYLLRRLREAYPAQEERFLCLYGGMDDAERERIKYAFNDVQAPVRVLLATDAASEGLNLQSTARYLLHYDCPWNPSRLEQRNGRLDRHGQARDVQIYHFASELDTDVKFMDYLIRKVDQIREDLGATGELFDEATQRRLIYGQDFETVKTALEAQVQQVQNVSRSDLGDNVDQAISEADSLRSLEVLAEEINLTPETARQVLDTALSLSASRPQTTQPDELERFRLINPSLPDWKDMVDETIRKQSQQGVLGAMPKLTFSPQAFLDDLGGRKVFRPRQDTMMLHLGHPMMQKACGSLLRRRFPGPAAVSRWTVRYGPIPAGLEALVMLYLEELGVNELRETFHHWIRPLALPFQNGDLLAALPHKEVAHFRQSKPCKNPEQVQIAREWLELLEQELKGVIKTHRQHLTAAMTQELERDGIQTRQQEEEKYKSRQGEISALIANNTIEKIKKEIEKLKLQRRQGVLFDEDAHMDRLDREIQQKQEEIERRRRHYEEVAAQLSYERERIMKLILPKRFALNGQAQVFPLALEIYLPQEGY